MIYKIMQGVQTAIISSIIPILAKATRLTPRFTVDVIACRYPVGQLATDANAYVW
jgi:hypothetical protein